MLTDVVVSSAPPLKSCHPAANRSCQGRSTELFTCAWAVVETRPRIRARMGAARSSSPSGRGLEASPGCRLASCGFTSFGAVANPW